MTVGTHEEMVKTEMEAPELPPTAVVGTTTEVGAGATGVTGMTTAEVVALV
jgi:hypothetical protein